MARITIEIGEPHDRELAGLTDRDLRWLFMDALYEFVMHRGPSPVEYVDRRYPDDTVYRGEARERKVAQVLARNRWAEAIRHGEFTLEHETGHK
jgi:hypothetical protein